VWLPLSRTLDTGKDMNGNGRIDLDQVERGLNQLEAPVCDFRRREASARTLVIIVVG
jgi:hypothetical protein